MLLENATVTREDGRLRHGVVVTWKKGYKTNSAPRIRELVADLVDAFINEWLADNQPEGTGCR